MKKNISDKPLILQEYEEVNKMNIKLFFQLDFIFKKNEKLPENFLNNFNWFISSQNYSENEISEKNDFFGYMEISDNLNLIPPSKKIIKPLILGLTYYIQEIESPVAFFKLYIPHNDNINNKKCVFFLDSNKTDTNFLAILKIKNSDQETSNRFIKLKSSLLWEEQIETKNNQYEILIANLKIGYSLLIQSFCFENANHSILEQIMVTVNGFSGFYIKDYQVSIDQSEKDFFMNINPSLQTENENLSNFESEETEQQDQNNSQSTNLNPNVPLEDQDKNVFQLNDQEKYRVIHNDYYLLQKVYEEFFLSTIEKEQENKNKIISVSSIDHSILSNNQPLLNLEIYALDKIFGDLVKNIYNIKSPFQNLKKVYSFREKGVYMIGQFKQFKENYFLKFPHLGSFALNLVFNLTSPSIKQVFKIFSPVRNNTDNINSHLRKL